MIIQAALPFRLLFILAILTLPSCKDDEHLSQLQEEVRTLSDQQNQARSETNRLKAQLDSLGKERDALKADRARLDAEVETLRKTLDQLQRDFTDYRSKYRISMREKAPGMDLGDIVVDGRTYRKVKVREATEDLLSILHDSGLQKFAWNVLPVEIRKLFGLEEPGEHVMINYAAKKTEASPPSLDEMVKRRDAELMDIQKQIGGTQSELKNIAAEERYLRKAISDAKYKKLDDVNLKRALNALSVKRTRLDFEERRLKAQRDELLKSDPRKKKL